MFYQIKNLMFLLKLFYLLIRSNIIYYLLLLLISDDISYKSNIKTKLGAKFTLILIKLGPLFIKLGQVLSTRSDILSDEIISKLTQMNDTLPPFSFQQVQKIFQLEFNTSIENIFTSFEKKSIAAASIAQVHKAITKNGEAVAVKILRPKIKKKYSDNLHFIQYLSTILNFFLRKKKVNFNEVINTLKKTAKIETDLRLEAAAADKIKENCQKDSNIYIPKVHWELTRKRILTLEWIEGTSINKIEELKSNNFNLDTITKNLAIIFLNQACRDGLFHADIHPGNIIIRENNDIALVDFGIVCDLKYELKIFVVDVMYGFLNKKYSQIKDLHFKTGYISSDQSEFEFELACRSIGEAIIGKPIGEISLGRLLKHLFEISRNFSVKIHPELLLLHKTILTIEGISYKLNPKINMWQLARPWIKDWANENLSTKSKILKLKNQQENFIKKIKKIIYHNYKSKVSNHSNKKVLRLSLLITIINMGVLLNFLFKNITLSI